MSTTHIRESILDAAETLLAHFGYRKMTIDDIARQAGIGKGTIYLYFPSKQEIVLCTIDRIVEVLLDRLRGIAASQQPFDLKVRAFLLERVLFRFDSVKAYPEGLDEVLRALRPAYLLRREKYLASEAEILQAVLAEGIEAGRCRCPDSLATSRAMLDATNSLLPFALSRKQLGSRKKVEHQVTQIADLIIHGLLVRESMTGAQP